MQTPKQGVFTASTSTFPLVLSSVMLFMTGNYALADAQSTADRAEAEAYEMETVTVSATPITIDDAGGSVSIITREDILRRNSPTINALLREVPGFAVSQSGAEGATSALRVRGAESNHVLVLVNGIEANDPAIGDAFEFNQVSISDVERIEIVRGPQSSLWGSDAMAGVIHIITTPLSDESSIDANIETGSFSTNRVNLAARNTFGDNRMKFDLDYRESDGTNISRQGDEDDGLESLHLSLAGNYAATDDFSLDYTIRHTDKTVEFDGTDFASGLPKDAENETESTALYAGATLTHKISDRFGHGLSLAQTDTENDTTGSFPGVVSATKDRFKYQFNAIGNEHRLSLLLERETVDFEQKGPVVTGLFGGDPNQNRSLDTDSFAAEYRYDAEQFNFSFSARRDSNGDFDDANAWRVTGSFKFMQDVTAFVSAGESVTNPTFSERFGFYYEKDSSFVGNEELQPETSLQWEIGVRGTAMDNRLNVALTGFIADLKDEIIGYACSSVNDENGSPVVNMDGEQRRSCTPRQREGKSKRRGAELEIGYALNEWTDLAFAYTYLDATEENASGKDVTEIRRPDHIASLSLNYSWARGGMNLALNYTGKQEDDHYPPPTYAPERKTLDAYTLLSLSGHYTLNERVTLTARLENLLDDEYEQVYGFASPGFAAYMGVKLSFDAF